MSVGSERSGVAPRLCGQRIGHFTHFAFTVNFTHYVKTKPDSGFTVKSRTLHTDMRGRESTPDARETGERGVPREICRVYYTQTDRARARGFLSVSDTTHTSHRSGCADYPFLQGRMKGRREGRLPHRYQSSLCSKPAAGGTLRGRESSPHSGKDAICPSATRPERHHCRNLTFVVAQRARSWSHSSFGDTRRPGV